MNIILIQKILMKKNKNICKDIQSFSEELNKHNEIINV